MLHSCLEKFLKRHWQLLLVTALFLRLQYHQEAQRAYHRQMAEAGQGGGTFPAVTTFRPSLTSTQSIYHEMAMAEFW